MHDDLHLLKALPRVAPSEEVRRRVRVAALDRLAAQAPLPWWRAAWRQLAAPLALASVSAFQLFQAAGHTPLLR